MLYLINIYTFYFVSSAYISKFTIDNVFAKRYIIEVSGTCISATYKALTPNSINNAYC